MSNSLEEIYNASVLFWAITPVYLILFSGTYVFKYYLKKDPPKIFFTSLKSLAGLSAIAGMIILAVYNYHKV